VATVREFCFSDEDLKALAHERYPHPHPHVQRKREVLWLKSHGLPHQQLADLAGVSLRTVQGRRKRFMQAVIPLLGRSGWRHVGRCVFAKDDVEADDAGRHRTCA
jgi:hypothetical protein